VDISKSRYTPFFTKQRWSQTLTEPRPGCKKETAQWFWFCFKWFVVLYTFNPSRIFITNFKTKGLPNCNQIFLQMKALLTKVYSFNLVFWFSKHCPDSINNYFLLFSLCTKQIYEAKKQRCKQKLWSKTKQINSICVLILSNIVAYSIFTSWPLSIINFVLHCFFSKLWNKETWREGEEEYNTKIIIPGSVYSIAAGQIICLPLIWIHNNKLLLLLKTKSYTYWGIPEQ
jgi:hypothetical protein